MESTNTTARFDAIYAATYKTVLAYIGAKCRRVADVSDIMQETYAELYRALLKRGADYPMHDQAFVLKIARQKLSRYYSLAQRLRMFVSLPAQAEEAAPPDWAIDTFDMAEFAVNSALLEEARTFLRSKPQDVQKVFFLYYEAGLTIAETAQEIGLTESSVKNKLYRTLKEIRRLWE